MGSDPLMKAYFSPYLASQKRDIQTSGRLTTFGHQLGHENYPRRYSVDVGVGLVRNVQDFFKTSTKY